MFSYCMMSSQCSSFICCQRHWILTSCVTWWGWWTLTLLFLEQSRNSPILELRKCTKVFKNSLGLTILTKSYHRYVLKWTRGKCDCFISSFYWQHRIAWPNQNSVFQRCEPVVYARHGLWNDDCGMHTKLSSLVWAHQAWHCAKHIEKPFCWHAMKHLWLWLVIV